MLRLLAVITVACLSCSLGGCLASGILGGIGSAVGPGLAAGHSMPHDQPMDPSIVRSIQDGDSGQKLKANWACQML